MNFNTIYYDLPIAGYLIPLALLLFFLFWKLYEYRQRTLRQYFDQNSLKTLLFPRLETNFWAKALAFCLIWILTAVALMQPKGNERYPSNTLSKDESALEAYAKLRRKAHEIIFLVDVSASMMVLDGRDGVSRLAFAKEIADQIASQLTGESASLYVFTSKTLQVVPATMDYLFLRLMMRDIQINEGDAEGTDFLSAFQTIKENYLTKPKSDLKSVILLSDGGDTELEAAGGAEKEKRLDLILKLLDNVDADHLKVYTIAVGSKQGKDIPGITYEGKTVHSGVEEPLMEEIAKKGRGKYYLADNYNSLGLATEVIKEMKPEHPLMNEVNAQVPLHNNENQDFVYSLFYQFPLGLAIILLIMTIFSADTASLKKWLSISCLLFSSGLWADDPTQILRKGAIYVEAQDFPQALTVYQGLLSQNLDPWQKAVVEYNEGTTLLLKGDLDSAITQFQNIVVDPSFPLILQSRLQANMALTFLRKAKEISDEAHSEASFLGAIEYWKKALIAFNDAIVAHCQLMHVEGETDCETAQSLQKFREVAKGNLADILQKFQNFQIKEMELAEALPNLQFSFDELNKNLHFLIDQKIPENLKQKYFDFFIKNADTWLPLWRPLAKREEKNHPEAEETKLYLDIYKHYRYAIRFLEKGKPEMSLNGVKQANPLLRQLRQLSWQKEALVGEISDLYDFYQLALDSKPLQEIALARLLSFHQQLDEVKLTQEMKDKLDEAKSNLTQSIQFLQKNKKIESQLYLSEAAQGIKRLQWKLNPSVDNVPETILTHTIEEQNHALSLTQFAASIKTSEVKKLLENSQKSVTERSNPFLDESIEYQKKLYDAELTPGAKEKRCQKSPWDQVFPLYDKGDQAALEAGSQLKEARWDLAMLKQNEALDAWKNALKDLRSKKSYAGCQEELQDQQNQSPAETAEMDNVIQLIEQMDNQDRIPVKTGPILEKVKRPW